MNPQPNLLPLEEPAERVQTAQPGNDARMGVGTHLPKPRKGAEVHGGKVHPHIDSRQQRRARVRQQIRQDVAQRFYGNRKIQREIAANVEHGYWLRTGPSGLWPKQKRLSVTLPPKAVNALVSFKEKLMAQSVIITPEPVELPPISLPKRKEPRRFMRHARERSGPFQRACRRREWFAPVH